MGAKESLQNARDWALDRWADFRAESPYFQAKVGLGAGYVVIVLLTILLAPPRGAYWTCTQEHLQFGLSSKTALLITNLRNGSLDDVTVDIHGTGVEFDGKKTPGKWHTKPLSLVEGLPTKILTEQMFDDQGANPPYNLFIDEAKVIEKKGRSVVTLSPTTTTKASP